MFCTHSRHHPGRWCGTVVAVASQFDTHGVSVVSCLELELAPPASSARDEGRNPINPEPLERPFRCCLRPKPPLPSPLPPKRLLEMVFPWRRALVTDWKSQGCTHFAENRAETSGQFRTGTASPLAKLKRERHPHHQSSHGMSSVFALAVWWETSYAYAMCIAPRHPFTILPSGIKKNFGSLH